MTTFVFANGYRSTLSNAQTVSGTTLTPGSTAGVPTIDPTAAVPLTLVVLVDVDPTTGLPTASTEIEYVTDTRTVPWTVQRAAESVVGGVQAGAPIAHNPAAAISVVASKAVLEQIGVPGDASVTPAKLSAATVAMFDPAGAAASGDPGVLGSRILAAGHSYMTGGGATDPDRQFLTLLAGMTHSDLSDLAVGGAQVGDDNMSAPGAIASAGYNSWGGWAQVLQTWAPARSSAPYTPLGVFPLVMFGHNDMTQHKTDATGNPRLIFQTALRTVLSRLAAARVFEDTATSVVFTGSWAASLASSGLPAHINGSGSSRRPVDTGTTPVVTITLPADFEGGTVALGWTVSPNSAGTVTLTGTASVVTAGGALNNAAYSMAGLAYAANGNTGDGKRDSANGHVIRIPGLVASDAGKTIIATITGVSATRLATPAQPGVPTVNGTAGATTYTYAWIEGNESGWTAQSATRSVTTGNATLSASNSITVPALGAFPAGVRWRALVRTAGGNIPGLVAIVTSNVAVTDSSPYALAPTPTLPGTNPLQSGFSFDYWQIEAENPMTRGIVMNTPRVITYSNGAGDADVANYNADMAAVMAEFPTGQWTLFDTDGTLAKNAVNFAGDGIHPNDRGHQAIAAGVFSTIRTVALTMPLASIAAQAQVLKRVSARQLVTRRWGLTVDNRNYLITAAAAVDLTRLLMQINAEVGEDLEAIISGTWSNEASTAYLDFCTVDNAGNPINFFQAQSEAARSTMPSTTSLGVLAGTATIFPIRGTIQYTVRAEDIQTVNTIPGIVSVVLWGTASGGGRTLNGGGTNTSAQLQIGLKNLGRRNAGFNTS